MQTLKTIRCKPHLCRADGLVCLSSLARVVSQKHNPAILGGNDSVEGYSIFTAEPLEVFEFYLDDDKPFERLAAALSKYQLSNEKMVTVPVFCGGWIGFFGYELGRFIETLPAGAVDDMNWPVIRLAFYDKAVIYDHTTETFMLAALEIDGDHSDIDQKFRALNDWLAEAKAVSAHQWPPTDLTDIKTENLSCNMTRSQYMQAMDRIKQYIIDGDTYQINFSQRFQADFAADPVDLFEWQNTHNPSPWAAFLAWDNRAVVSASPELFLQVSGNRIVTKPIKGTRPRNPHLNDQSPENRTFYHDLAQSEKDCAELAMIVDLERNDLARICIPGTRRLTCPRQIETFPTVYHAVAAIEGQLKDPPGPQRIIEILKATFPGGSISGAPKIRSMEIIDELEPTARSVYTGSIGFIDLNYNLCLNIAIRTILIENQTAYVQTGGGIVADSDPDAEWAETITKARALLAGIRAVQHHTVRPK